MTTQLTESRSSCSAYMALGKAFMRGTAKGQLLSIYKLAKSGDNLLKVLAYCDALANHEVSLPAEMTPALYSKLELIQQVEDTRPIKAGSIQTMADKPYLITALDGTDAYMVLVDGVPQAEVDALISAIPARAPCNYRIEGRAVPNHTPAGEGYLVCNFPL